MKKRGYRTLENAPALEAIVPKELCCGGVDAAGGVSISGGVNNGVGVVTKVAVRVMGPFLGRRLK